MFEIRHLSVLFAVGSDWAVTRMSTFSAWNVFSSMWYQKKHVKQFLVLIKIMWRLGQFCPRYSKKVRSPDIFVILVIKTCISVFGIQNLIYSIYQNTLNLVFKMLFYHSLFTQNWKLCIYHHTSHASHILWYINSKLILKKNLVILFL